jgi:putative membrane protein
MYLYLKAIHVIFVVTWFAGLFYLPRLLIYNTEALSKPAGEQLILQRQFAIMIKRLWYGITWPSAILTLILGCTTWYKLAALPDWLLVKLFFVAGLYAYHLSLHVLVRQQLKGIFRFTSQQLRIWNEMATIFLVAIVILAVVKQPPGLWRALGGLLLFIGLLLGAIRIYKRSRRK